MHPTPLQATELRAGQEDLRGSLNDVKANLEEVRQQAAHRYASEIERIQDQNELLFSTWSEALRDELEGRQDRVIQQVQGELLRDLAERLPPGKRE